MNKKQAEGEIGRLNWWEIDLNKNHKNDVDKFRQSVDLWWNNATGPTFMTDEAHNFMIDQLLIIKGRHPYKK